MTLSFSFTILPRRGGVVLNYCDWITEALRSTFITKVSSLLWLRPTLLVASPVCNRIELQYEL